MIQKLLKIVMMKWRKFWRIKMYENKIRILEESFRVINDKINDAEKDIKFNKDTLSSLQKQREIIYNELRRIRRLEYEETQRVNLDDDR